MDQSRHRRRLANSGFTLVELLIATSILLIVLTTTMFGYQLYQTQWQRNLSQIDASYQQLRRFELLSTALHGIVPYMVNVKAQQSFYFLGRTEGFTAVTIAPVFNPGAPAVIRIFKEAQTNGQYRLVYEEASLQQAALIEPDQQLPFNHRLIITEQQTSIIFGYFTEPDREGSLQFSEEGDLLKPAFVWLPEHDALVKRTHPTKLSINLSGFDWQLPVADRSQALFNRNRPSIDIL